MAEWQLRRDHAFSQQTLGAVEIRKQRIEYARALRDACFYRAPFLRAQHQRQRIERPRTIGALRIRVHVVRNAVLDDESARELDTAPRRCARIGRGKSVDQARASAVAPHRSRRATRHSAARPRRSSPELRSALRGSLLSEIEREGMVGIRRLLGRRDHPWRMAHPEEAREAAALGLRMHSPERSRSCGRRDASRGTGSRPSSAASRCRRDRT